MRRIILEVATAETSLAFRFGRPAQRAAHAPVLRGASVIDDTSGQAAWYSLEHYAELWAALRGADEVITWNGNHAAMLVLRRVFGARHFPIRRGQVALAWGRHIDLCELIETERRLTHRISLAKAIRFTFGEDVRSRRPKGKIAIDARIQRAQANAAQILRLWRAYHRGDGLALQGGPTLFHPDNEHRY